MQYILYCMLTTVLDALHLVLYVIVNIRWFSLKRNKSEINSFFISWSVIIQCKNKHCIIIDSLWDYGIMGLWDWSLYIPNFFFGSLWMGGWGMRGCQGVKKGFDKFPLRTLKNFFESFCKISIFTALCTKPFIYFVSLTLCWF